MRTGRPTRFTTDLAYAIAERLAQGEPLAKICADDAMPGYSTVRRWEDETPEFRALTVRARRDGTHFLADQCLQIADDPDIKVEEKRVRIDTRLRLIGKWNSRDYGDKQQVEHSGSIAARSEELTDDELARIASNRSG